MRGATGGATEFLVTLILGEVNDVTFARHDEGTAAVVVTDISGTAGGTGLRSLRGRRGVLSRHVGKLSLEVRRDGSHGVQVNVRADIGNLVIDATEVISHLLIKGLADIATVVVGGRGGGSRTGNSIVIVALGACQTLDD